MVECTTKATKYKHADRPHIILWDLPGCGTVRENTRDYFPRWQLYAFDCLLIVLHRTIHHSDMELAKLATEHKIPVAVIRQKDDLCLASLARQYPNMDNLGLQSILRKQATQKFEGKWSIYMHVQMRASCRTLCVEHKKYKCHCIIAQLCVDYS